MRDSLGRPASLGVRCCLSCVQASLSVLCSGDTGDAGASQAAEPAPRPACVDTGMTGSPWTTHRASFVVLAPGTPGSGGPSARTGWTPAPQAEEGGQGPPHTPGPQESACRGMTAPQARMQEPASLSWVTGGRPWPLGPCTPPTGLGNGAPDWGAAWSRGRAPPQPRAGPGRGGTGGLDLKPVHNSGQHLGLESVDLG